MAETGVWVAGLAGAFDVDRGLGAPFEGDALGVAAGIERQMTLGPLRGATVGLALGYTNTDVSNPFDTAEIDAFHVGAYASGSIGVVQTASALSYSYLDIELPGALDANGHVVTSRTDAAIDALAVAGVTLGPVARLETLFASIDGVAAIGPLGTALAGSDASQLIAGIGVRAGLEVGPGTVRIDALYEHAFGDDALVFGANVIGQPFAVGASLGDDERFRLGAGYDVRVGSAEIGLRYDGTFADDSTAHSGSVRVGFRF